ncbi:MAG: hypothetical protein AB1792_02245 [Candidatus Zixiibacteriota bacterium]
MKDTTIRRLALATVIALAMGSAGCALIITSDAAHRSRYDDYDCEDCHTTVVIVDYKSAPDSSVTVVSDSTVVARECTATR